MKQKDLWSGSKPFFALKAEDIVRIEFERAFLATLNI
jgi:hypothetical protein